MNAIYDHVGMETLICKGLNKEYEPGKYALRSVSLSIPASGIFALIGRNGAGKTTLVRILATQLMPTSGSATIDGMDVVRDADRLRESIACVPQEARLIGWLTPRQLVMSYLYWRGFGKAEADDRGMAALRKLGIERFANTLGRALSGGIKRKVLVAAVMASEARVLFLDEPTTGLDPISRAELWGTLQKLKKDHFIFLTTHYLEEAERLADTIGILDNGRLMAMGTLEELRGMVRYPYSIKILSKTVVEKPKHGELIVGADGQKQIVTTEDEANMISTKLIKAGVRLSMSPLSLDDIFYYVVRKPIEAGDNNDEEESW